MRCVSIIDTVRDQRRDTSKHIACITGRRYVSKPHFYRNRESNESYYSLAAGLAFPAVRTPGFAVIVAVMKDDSKPDSPCFKVLDEIEEMELEALLRAYEARRHRWGYPDQLGFLYGDPERFTQALNGFNERLQRGVEFPGGIYLAPPSGFEDLNRTEIYLHQLRALLLPTDNGSKRLILGECQRLRGHIQNMPLEVRDIEDYPAIAALAYAVHSLEVTGPWMEYVKPERFIPTINEPYLEVFGAWDDDLEEEESD